jgi:hypothetical protein
VGILQVSNSNDYDLLAEKVQKLGRNIPQDHGRRREEKAF